jgi:hypothetical protein
VSGTVLGLFGRPHRPLPVGERDTCVLHIGSACVGDFYCTAITDEQLGIRLAFRALNASRKPGLG